MNSGIKGEAIISFIFLIPEKKERKYEANNKKDVSFNRWDLVLRKYFS